MFDSYNKIIARYTCARLEGDLATTTAILNAAIEHDKVNTGRPPLMPLLDQAATYTPPRAFNS